MLLSPYGCTDSAGHAESLKLTRECPEIAAKLGSPIERGWGFSNYESSAGGVTRYTTMTFPVSGPRGSGRLEYVHSNASNPSGLLRLLVEVDGKIVDVLSCVGRGSSVPVIPTS